MVDSQELQAAIGTTSIARLNAAARMRSAGDPHNPYAAQPGREQEYFEAAQSVRTYDLILKLLENEVKRQALERMRPARAKLNRIANRAASIYIVGGLTALATLGFAAAGVLLKLSVPLVSTLAIIGVAVSLGWAVVRK